MALHRPARLVSVPQWFLEGAARTLEKGAFLPYRMRRRADDIRRLTGSFVVDSTSARDTLGFVPSQTLDDGLREAAEWWHAGSGTSGPDARHRPGTDHAGRQPSSDAAEPSASTRSERQRVLIGELQHFRRSNARRPELAHLDARGEVRDDRRLVRMVAPAASIVARYAVTVSPAPTTS